MTYNIAPNTDDNILRCDDNGPTLKYSDKFDTILSTLSEDQPIPPELIVLGLFSNELTPTDSRYIRSHEYLDDFEPQRARVPTKTLLSVRRFLYELKDELDEETKQILGDICEITHLNTPPNDVKKEDLDKIDIQYDCADLFKKSTKDVVNSRNNPFDKGKRITKRGGERITGKNPFADPSKLKDAGLHQGGGD